MGQVRSSDSSLGSVDPGEKESEMEGPSFPAPFSVLHN